MAKLIDLTGLSYFYQKINALFATKAENSTKVDKISGKGLSTNDLTDTLKSSYDNAVTMAQALTDAGAEANKVNDVTVNGTSVVTDKAAAVTVPTAVSELTNDSSYQTADEVNQAIEDKFAAVNGVQYSIVDSLPSTGAIGTIYCVKTSEETNNLYDEYIYLDSAFEKLGPYLETATDTEIEAIFEES